MCVLLLSLCLKNALKASVDVWTKMDNTAFSILSRKICYVYSFKNIYCFMRFSNTSISFKLIIIKRVMFLAPVPTWLFLQMWIFNEETYHLFSLVNSTSKNIIFPHSLPVVCLFAIVIYFNFISIELSRFSSSTANSYNHVSLCMPIGLVYIHMSRRPKPSPYTATRRNYTVSQKNDNDVYTITSTHINRFW